MGNGIGLAAGRLHWPCKNIASELHASLEIAHYMGVSETTRWLSPTFLNTETRQVFFFFFFSLGVQNIRNPEMLAIFLSHIKIPI